MEGPSATASSSSSSLLLPAVQAVFAGSLAQFEQSISFMFNCTAIPASSQANAPNNTCRSLPSAAAAPAPASAASATAQTQAADPYLRSVCKLQALVRGIRARRVVSLTGNVGGGGTGQHSWHARGQARQAVRDRRRGSNVTNAAPSPPARALQPSPPTVALVPSSSTPAAAAASVAALAVASSGGATAPAASNAPARSLRPQASAPNLNVRRRSASPVGTVAAATAAAAAAASAPNNTNHSFRPVQPQQQQQLGQGQSILIPSRSLSRANSLSSVSSAGSISSSGRTSPSPESPLLSDMDLELESASESTSGGGLPALPALGSASSGSLHGTTTASHPTATCVLGAEARLVALRRSAGRALPATSMSVTQLLEEKRALRKELQQARDRHQPMTAAQARNAAMNTATNTTSGRLGSAAASRPGAVRARSVSPAPGQKSLAGSTSSTSSGGGGGGLQCDSCLASGSLDTPDWKALYQPLLLQFKLVNAALRAKGVSVDAAVVTVITSNPPPSSATNVASSVSSAGGTTGSQQTNSQAVMRRHSSGGINTMVLPNKQHQLVPINFSATNGAASGSSVSLLSQQPGSVQQQQQQQSQSITIACGRGVTRRGSLGSLGGGSGGGLFVPSIGGVGGGSGGGGGGSASTPSSRSNSRSSSPTLMAQQSHLATGGFAAAFNAGIAGLGAGFSARGNSAAANGAQQQQQQPSSSFAQWTREVAQAQAASGHAAAASSSSSSSGSSSGGGNGGATLVRVQKPKAVGAALSAGAVALAKR